MQRPVSLGPQQGDALGSIALQVGTEAPVLEALPHVVNRLLRGVQHVGGIKAVVAQFVEHDFVGRKIIDAVHCMREGVDEQ